MTEYITFPGEIRDKYKDKKITLVHSSPMLVRFYAAFMFFHYVLCYFGLSMSNPESWMGLLKNLITFHTFQCRIGRPVLQIHRWFVKRSRCQGKSSLFSRDNFGSFAFSGNVWNVYEKEEIKFVVDYPDGSLVNFQVISTAHITKSK